MTGSPELLPLKQRIERRYIRQISSDRIDSLVRGGRLEATTNFDGLGKADAVVICVPTPLTRHREPDLQYVEQTTDAVASTHTISTLAVPSSFD